MTSPRTPPGRYVPPDKTLVPASPPSPTTPPGELPAGYDWSGIVHDNGDRPPTTPAPRCGEMSEHPDTGVLYGCSLDAGHGGERHTAILDGDGYSCAAAYSWPAALAPPAAPQAEEPARWKPVEVSPGTFSMERSSTGGYVLYADYLALASPPSGAREEATFTWGHPDKYVVSAAGAPSGGPGDECPGCPHPLSEHPIVVRGASGVLASCPENALRGAPETAPLTMDEINEYASAYTDHVTRDAFSPEERHARRERYNAAYAKLSDRLAPSRAPTPGDPIDG